MDETLNAIPEYFIVCEKAILTTQRSRLTFKSNENTDKYPLQQIEK